MKKLKKKLLKLFEDADDLKRIYRVFSARHEWSSIYNNGSRRNNVYYERRTQYLNKYIYWNDLNTTTLSEFINSLKMITSYMIQQLKGSLTTTSSSSVNTLFSSCIISGPALSFGYHTNMALACLLKIFGYGRIRLCQQP